MISVTVRNHRAFSELLGSCLGAGRKHQSSSHILISFIRLNSFVFVNSTFKGNLAPGTCSINPGQVCT
ncbi:hypothetical protein GDO78_001360 [Eleutherodactylus coqui]|uniref:Uncharacterized protein n=1 Tax=Eleutherodactylus coqui TaxID=57060 RepID=A0A8J6FSN3_ELECQ|nr:hypothetical protein GDO78_001360 [Eleutherodactylus coqui]